MLQEITGDGSTSTFTVTSGTAVDNVIVTENGVVQVYNCYKFRTTLTFQGGAYNSSVQYKLEVKIRINIRNDY